MGKKAQEKLCDVKAVCMRVEGEVGSLHVGLISIILRCRGCGDHARSLSQWLCGGIRVTVDGTDRKGTS